jgi:hypothetical protein
LLNGLTARGLEVDTASGNDGQYYSKYLINSILNYYCANPPDARRDVAAKKAGETVIGALHRCIFALPKNKLSST